MTELILSGKAAKILDQKAILAKERNRIFDCFFPEAVKPGTPAAFFRWLPVKGLHTDEMETERLLQMLNVNVYCSYRFTVSRSPGNFMRIAISSPPDVSSLSKGCSVIREFLRNNQCEEN